MIFTQDDFWCLIEQVLCGLGADSGVHELPRHGGDSLLQQSCKGLRHIVERRFLGYRGRQDQDRLEQRSFPSLVLRLRWFGRLHGVVDFWGHKPVWMAITASMVPRNAVSEPHPKPKESAQLGGDQPDHLQLLHRHKKIWKHTLRNACRVCSRSHPIPLSLVDWLSLKLGHWTYM